MDVQSRNAISTGAGVAIVVVLLVIAGGAYYYIAYYSPPAKTTTSAQLSGTLNVITFTDPSNAWLQDAANTFMAAHPGVTIHVTAQGFSSYTTTELTSLKAQSSTYDIITFTSTSALGFASYVSNLNGLVNLNTSDIPAPQLNFGGYYLVNGTKELIGVPYDTSTFTIFYNQTLLSNAALNAQFESQYGFPMSPPWSSWQAILDVNHFLVTQTHTVKYGLITDGSEGHDIIDTYPAIFGYYYAHDSSISGSNPQGGLLNYNIMFNGFAGSSGVPSPSFNGTAGVQALQTMYNLMQYDPQPAGTTVGYGTVFAPLQAGESWGSLMFTADASTLLSSKNISSSIAVSSLPGGYAETGTDFYAINKYSNNQALAAAFIQYLVSPTVNAKIYTVAGEFPISRAATAILTSNTSIPQQARNVIQQVFDTGAVGWANPPNLVITSSTLIPAFNQPVYGFLTGTSNSTSSAQQALDTAAAAWLKAVS
ncbi:MAG: extracellular solute-binding protein [Nitrososphaerota archaeon]|nr:extracellular solute-binding protein [Nitrososphaerota archaeon]